MASEQSNPIVGKTLIDECKDDATLLQGKTHQEAEAERLLAQDSKELKNYINGLASESRNVNAKSLCPICWCNLTYHQKQRILSLSQYSDIENFSILALKYCQFEEIDGHIYFETIKENPQPVSNLKNQDLMKKVLI